MIKWNTKEAGKHNLPAFLTGYLLNEHLLKCSPLFVKLFSRLTSKAGLMFFRVLILVYIVMIYHSNVIVVQEPIPVRQWFVHGVLLYPLAAQR